MSLLSDRSKTFSVSVSVFVCVFVFFFFSSFAISSANDSLSQRLLELLRRDRQKEVEEEENSLTELNKYFRKSIENNEIHESNCSSGQFPCSSSSVRCIRNEWVCDGDRDCEDGEDEVNCKKVKDCPNGQFLCPIDGGLCLPPQWICDGNGDCPDGSDERLCPSSTPRPGCSSGYFQCSSSSSSSSSSGSCIYDDWVCDGDRDCEDGEDEVNCKKVKECPEDGQFRCSSGDGGGVGRCLPLQWLCDGDADCPDGSDERLCDSSSTQKPHRSGCPPQSNYVAEFDQCYSPLVAAFVDWSEASAVCRGFHPRAHLPAIISHEQELFIRHLLLKDNPELCPLGVWTSGRRSNSFRPFTWRLPSSSTASAAPHPHPHPADEEGEGGWKEKGGSSEGEGEEQRALGYTNWMPQRPRIGFGQRENCLFIDRQNDFKWNQRRCEHLLCVVCQLDLHH